MAIMLTPELSGPVLPQVLPPSVLLDTPTPPAYSVAELVGSTASTTTVVVRPALTQLSPLFVLLKTPFSVAA